MNKYEIVLDVCKSGNISKTARKFNYTRSAVSQTIKNFEQELGCTLFGRSKSGIHLLPGTEEIVEYLQVICDAKNRIGQISANLANIDSGYIRIGTIHSIFYHFLSDVLKEFSEKYPRIKFEVTVDGFDGLNRKIEKKQVDCIFTSRYSVPGLSFLELGKDELVLVTPVGHPLSELPVVSILDVNGQDFILSSDGLDYEIGKIFELNGIHPNIRFSVNDDYAVMKMVESGFGVSILPKLLCDRAPYHVCIRSFSEHYTRTLGVAYEKDENSGLAMMRFLDYIKEIKGNM